MTVITIARQYGSLGDEIGQQVAERLKLRFVDQDIINEVADRLGVPAAAVNVGDEREATVVSELVRTMRRLYPATIVPPSQTDNSEVDEAAYLQVIRQVIWEVARADNAVIVGRGAALILERHPGLLHVLVTAPLEVRLERVMGGESLDHDHAMQKIKQSDANRERYIRHFYRANWLDVNLYDLAINTGHFSQVTAVALLESAVRAENPR